jgi:hypothetical protein
MPVEVRTHHGEPVCKIGGDIVPRKGEDIIVGQKIWTVYRVEHRIIGTEVRVVVVVV